MSIVEKKETVHCPMCHGTPPAHFEDCKSFERLAQNKREEEMQAAQEAAEAPQAIPVLFIGGPRDGERIDMSKLPATFAAPYENPDRDLPQPKYEPPAPAYLYTPYRLEAIKSGPDSMYPVYVIDGIPHGDVLHLLLDNYRPKKS